MAGPGRHDWKYVKDEEFKEAEVWDVMEEIKENSSPKLRKPSKNSSFSVNPRIIPKSSSSDHQKQSSAPVDIPDWSKIYGKTLRKMKNGCTSTSWVDSHGYYLNGNTYHHHHHNDINGCYDGGFYDDDDGNVNDDDDDDDMVPPHEFLAKKLARSQISSFSVYEGIGRTLKGRDLSKVRNAILTKTGFLE
ncbi:protein S40-4-like [Amaranthus tricolor]|uniref:protein S40-4-like n=1 Tax=Amaranthus tricolor TaxID=29722 RepID=UPI00258D2249|nr:protein S40-4-like [Amaranthus tricolor]